MDWKLWAKGLIAAIISAAANAVTGTIVAPETFNLQDGWTKLVALIVVNAIVGAAMYLKQSPIPGDNTK